MTTAALFFAVDEAAGEADGGVSAVGRRGGEGGDENARESVNEGAGCGRSSGSGKRARLVGIASEAAMDLGTAAGRQADAILLTVPRGLSGGCGASSLLCQFAYNKVLCAARGDFALFVCHSSRRHEPPPLPVHVAPNQGAVNQPLAAPVLDLIKVKYVENAEQLVRLVCNLHQLAPCRPHILVLDDVERICAGMNPADVDGAEVLRVLALARNGLGDDGCLLAALQVPDAGLAQAPPSTSKLSSLFARRFHVSRDGATNEFCVREVPHSQRLGPLPRGGGGLVRYFVQQIS